MIDDRNLKHALIPLGKRMWAPCLHKIVCLERIMRRYTPSAHEPSAYHILKQSLNFLSGKGQKSQYLTLLPEPICRMVMKCNTQGTFH